jgi:tight adherence protein B
MSGNMTNPVLLSLVVGLLLVAALGMWVVLGAQARDKRDRQRVIGALGEIGTGASVQGGKVKAEKRRRKEIEATLKEMEAKQRAKLRREVRVTLETRIRQAGLRWTRGGYLLICVASGVLGALFATGLLGLGLLLSIGVGVAVGLAGPHLFLSMARARRIKAFIGELPDALDTIVRGVRTGLPLGDCIRTIAAEGREPVRTEFRRLTEETAIGIPIDQAAERMFERMPVLEVRLLGIILGIQSRSGGNLSEAVGNLSGVLRSRKKMQAKIKAMSSEATASAGIIGALPVAVSGLMYLTAEEYISLLFTTTQGHIALGVAAVWMSIGILVMRNMIKFEV